MARQGLLNYTTQIPASKTLGEIMGMLAGAGARSLQVDYDGGNPTGLQFLIATRFGERGFQLPANVERVWKVLSGQYDQGRVQRRFATKEQAARVAWRIVRDWLDVQLALIEAGMVDLEEVMLPYMVHDSGQTVYQLMQAQQFKALGPGKGEGR